MADVVYREDHGSLHVAGVRCSRCPRIISVEWSDEIVELGRLRAEGMRIGRCEGCFQPPGEGEGGPDDHDLGGYVYVVLQPDGSFDVGTSPLDYAEGLTVIVTGTASCGCCEVSVVRCSDCATPVATRHAPIASIEEYMECGYCVHCDRIVGIDVHVRDEVVVREFVDRVASPDEIQAERWAAWRDVTQAELREVAQLRSDLDSIPEEELDLLELQDESILYAGNARRLTWESWLSTFGGDLPPGVRGRG